MSDKTPLGQPTRYADQYDPGLLFAIPRAKSRAALDLGNDLPFNGCDIWTAWELTWLNSSGVPQVASAEILVPAYSPFLIESKSLKLYLGSFAMTQIESTDRLQQMIESDLNACTGNDVELHMHSTGTETDIEEFAGDSIDSTDTNCDVFAVNPDFLETSDVLATETLHSHVLRSLCPVTDQPDLGSVMISYKGPQIDRAGLLRYIVSFRQHNDFHEACVERMFMDITEQCRPEQLTVYARYQRRGGIDINPFRSNFEAPPGRMRLRRQ
jgi:7-cyano-7-deazaguanine reductase